MNLRFQRKWHVGFVASVLIVLMVGLPGSSAQLPALPAASNTVGSVHVFGQNLILATTSDGLYKATATGWHRLTLPTWTQIDVSPDGIIYLYDLYGGLIHRSFDDGETWQQTGAFPYDTSDQVSLSVSPISGTLFIGLGTWVSRRWGVFKSTDSGLTWRQVISQPYGYGTAVTYSPNFAQDGTAFVALNIYHGNAGIWKSIDWGETWSELNTGSSSLGYLSEVVVSPQYSSDQTAFCTNFGQVYKTTDGGEHWTQLSVDVLFNDRVIVTLSPDYAHDQTLLIGGYYEGLSISRDGGLTFQRLFDTAVHYWGIRRQGVLGPTVVEPVSWPYRSYLPLISNALWALELWTVKSPQLFENGYLYRSRDYGATWEETSVFEASNWLYLPVLRR